MGRVKRSFIGAALVVVLLSSLVFVNPQTAEAQQWTVVGGSHGFVMVACKQAVNSIYGPLWRVEIGTANGSSHGHVASAQVRRGGVNGPVVNSLFRRLNPGAWPPNGSIFMSRLPWLGDTLVIGTGEFDGRGSGGLASIGDIAYC